MIKKPKSLINRNKKKKKNFSLIVKILIGLAVLFGLYQFYQYRQNSDPNKVF